MEKVEQLIKETTNNLILHLDHKPGDRKFIEGTLEHFRNLVIEQERNKCIAVIINNSKPSNEIMRIVREVRNLWK